MAQQWVLLSPWEKEMGLGKGMRSALVRQTQSIEAAD
jgi:hypothetical protein